MIEDEKDEYKRLTRHIKKDKPGQIKLLRVKDIKSVYEKMEGEDIRIIKIRARYLEDDNYVLRYNEDYYMINISKDGIIKWWLLSII